MQKDSCLGNCNLLLSTLLFGERYPKIWKKELALNRKDELTRPTNFVSFVTLHFAQYNSISKQDISNGMYQRAYLDSASQT